MIFVFYLFSHNTKTISKHFIHYEMINNETICALATPAGGAIGVIRVSGEKAIDITEKIFNSTGNHSLHDAKTQTLHYGEIRNAKNELIDDVVVSVYRAPRSYTGENSTEISCHGSRFIINEILRLLIDNGCRQAERGEYTMRAFMNGKMDLSQAEAVADLISARNKASHKMALSQLKGNFSSELARLREQLLKMTSLLELELDFSDQDVNFADRKELLELSQRIDARITSLALSFEKGIAMKEGIPVAIVGKTNVGKSTLLNQLLHEEKAIVSDIHGTTRDVIEDTTDINGITFRFIDTAGIRHTDDKVEQIGIERAYQKLDEARIVLWLIDACPSEEEFSLMEKRCEGKKLIIVRNKIDKDTTDNDSAICTEASAHEKIAISAKYGKGITALEDLLYKAADIPEISDNDVVVSNARHYEALTHAKKSITQVILGLQGDLSGDLIAEDLRACIHELAEIVGGEVTSQETLNNIFKHFCVGK